MVNPGSSLAQVDMAEIAKLGAPPPGNLAVPVFQHGSLEVEWYSPAGEDLQTPHERDEIYVVARGTAVFWNGQGRRNVAAGTFLFVAAGQPHRFETISADFGVWVFFYGPVGGESAARL
ncbi:MAG TPA: cupin domain-containing protein [Steroidobacteraceae bacterium]